MEVKIGVLHTAREIVLDSPLAPDEVEQAVADTVASDTGLGRDEAQLLATALTGAAQVAARWWLAEDRPISQEDAIRLLESLLWRGISNFPRQGS